LDALTAGGVKIAGFEQRLGGLLAVWIAYVLGLSPCSTNAGSSDMDMHITSALAADVFELTQACIRYNASFIVDGDMARIVHSACVITSRSGTLPPSLLAHDISSCQAIFTCNYV
jgi:hypothetical protein